MRRASIPKRKRPGPRAPIDGVASAISALNIVNAVPVSYVQSICGGLISILEVVEQVRQNKSDITRFANAANETAGLLLEETHSHTRLPGSGFQDACERFYNQICETVIQLDALKASNERHAFLKYLRTSRTSDAINQCEGALTELRNNLVLISTMGARMDVISKQETTRSLMAEMHQTLSLYSNTVSLLPHHLEEIQSQNPVIDGRFNVRQELAPHKPTFDKENWDDAFQTNIVHAGDSAKDRTIRVSSRKTEWKRELDLLKLVPRRPNLVQLYEELVFLEDYIVEKDPSAIEETRLHVNANAHIFLAYHHGLTVRSYHHEFYYADENVGPADASERLYRDISAAPVDEVGFITITGLEVSISGLATFNATRSTSSYRPLSHSRTPSRRISSLLILKAHIEYRFLREIHQECGYSLHSTQTAEYLGLPLFQLHDLDSEKVKDIHCDNEESAGEVAQLSPGLTACNSMAVIMTVVIFSVFGLSFLRAR
ncbi:hypothetical protein IW262DRAFT_1296151 [Armillaria fumosa]|nr:hypothetical protein IW262DRAFT_1296151 [Armillaria fumosa]